MVHSQESYNLNEAKPSQLFPSVQEHNKAEEMRLQLAEFLVSLFRSGQKSWTSTLAGKPSMVCGIPQETCPAASETAS